MYEIAVVLGFAFSSFIFAYMSLKLSKDHGVLQVLFMTFSLGMMMLTMTNTKFVAQNNADFNVTDTGVLQTFDMGYKISLYGLVLFLTYFFIMFLINSFKVLFDLYENSQKKLGKR